MSSRVSSSRRLSSSPSWPASYRAHSHPPVPPVSFHRRSPPRARSCPIHEAKYRLQVHLRDGAPTLYTRSGFDWTNRFPTVASDVTRLPAGRLVLDGEIISAVEDGRADFNALQDDLKRGRHDRLAYYAFDLLHLDGFDTRAAPLMERKRVLQAFLAEANGNAPRVLYCEHFQDGAVL
jgi:bifunctional non-homologous end joining protein LigD